MPSVDFRTRYQGDVVPLDPATFLDDVVPPLVDKYGPEAGRSATRVGKL